MKALKTTLMFSVLIIPIMLSAQPSFPSGLNDVPGVSIDQAAGILAVAGLLYAGYRLRINKK